MTPLSPLLSAKDQQCTQTIFCRLSIVCRAFRVTMPLCYSAPATARAEADYMEMMARVNQAVHGELYAAEKDLKMPG